VSRCVVMMDTSESADLKKMEKEQYRSVIRFLFLEGKSRSEVKERLDAVYRLFSFDGDRQKLV